MKYLLGGLLALCAVIFSPVGGAQGATLTGTIANSSGKTGRIYIVDESTGRGTSIPSAGAFTIRGVSEVGEYRVKAFLDVSGNGIQHANDPKTEVGTAYISNGTGSVGTLTLTTPQPVAALAPEFVGAVAGNGANIVMWDGPRLQESDAVIADSYNVYWSTSPGGNPVIGQMTGIVAGDEDFWIHNITGGPYYYRVEAVAGQTTAASSWVPAASGGGGVNVSGTVSFPSITPSGPLYIAMYDDAAEKFYLTAINNPVSPQTYTIVGVQPGKYEIEAFLDQNGSGRIDLGDIDLGDVVPEPVVTVADAPVAAPALTLVPSNSEVSLTTSHRKDKYSEGYSLTFRVEGRSKQPVLVSVASGPNILGPIDMGVRGWGEFETWHYLDMTRPVPGDTYTFDIEYSDGTDEQVTRQVTGVLDSFAASLAPVGPIPYVAAPTFSWTPPANPPGQDYEYNLWVSSSNGWVWDANDLPAGTTSVVYNFNNSASQPELTDNVNYYWNLTVNDTNGNSAESSASFIPTTYPRISGFSPTAGGAGTQVTIDGMNFSATPSENVVRFSGVQATVTSATPTRLLATVPQGAGSGQITVTVGGKAGESPFSFVVGEPISFIGKVVNSAGSGILGASIGTEGNPSLMTTTAADGAFTLGGLAGGSSFVLTIDKEGYLPVYTQPFYTNQSIDASLTPFVMKTLSELTTWGVTAGKGAIILRVVDDAGAPMSGVTVTASRYSYGGEPSNYPVSYTQDGVRLGGTKTAANGLAVILNTEAGGTVNVTAALPGWNFQPCYFMVRNGAVGEGALFGMPAFPAVMDFSPMQGKTGDQVVINGWNFDPVPQNNTVTIGGAQATVTSGNPDSLTVVVPSGAFSGPISVTTAIGSSQSFASFTVQKSLSVSINGNGQGSVHSVPGGISCINGSQNGCTAWFSQGTQVNLNMLADTNSIFTGWGGACGGNQGCTVNLMNDSTVNATFSSTPYAMIPGVNPSYFSLLSQAYGALQPGGVIMAREYEFIEPLNLNRGIAFTLKGGYDSFFANRIGYSIMRGLLTVTNGSLTVENIIVK